MERIYVFAPVPGWNAVEWGEMVDHTKLNPVARLEPIGYLAGWDYDTNQALEMTERVTAAGHVCKWFTRPLPSDDRTQVAALLAKTKDAARNGEFEGYKTTTNFDGTAHNPQWLG